MSTRSEISLPQIPGSDAASSTGVASGAPRFVQDINTGDVIQVQDILEITPRFSEMVHSHSVSRRGLLRGVLIMTPVAIGGAVLGATVNQSTGLSLSSVSPDAASPQASSLTTDSSVAEAGSPDAAGQDDDNVIHTPDEFGTELPNDIEAVRHFSAWNFGISESFNERWSKQRVADGFSGEESRARYAVLSAAVADSEVTFQDGEVLNKQNAEEFQRLGEEWISLRAWPTIDEPVVAIHFEGAGFEPKDDERIMLDVFTNGSPDTRTLSEIDLSVNGNESIYSVSDAKLEAFSDHTGVRFAYLIEPTVGAVPNAKPEHYLNMDERRLALPAFYFINPMYENQGSIVMQHYLLRSMEMDSKTDRNRVNAAFDTIDQLRQQHYDEAIKKASPSMVQQGRQGEAVLGSSFFAMFDPATYAPEAAKDPALSWTRTHMTGDSSVKDRTNEFILAAGTVLSEMQGKFMDRLTKGYYDSNYNMTVLPENADQVRQAALAILEHYQAMVPNIKKLNSIIPNFDSLKAALSVNTFDSTSSS